MRLPLQNLWATDVTDEQAMPIALLPFSQYDVALIVAMLLVGGAVGGVVFRARRTPRTVGTVSATLAGVLVVDLAAIVQSAVVTGSGLRRPTGFVPTLVTPEQVYLVGLVAIALVGTGLALLVCLLIAAVRAPGPVIGVAAAATTVTSWADAVLVSPTSISTSALSGLLDALDLLPGCVVGIAVGVLWRRPAGRQVVGAALGLGLAWVGPALSTTVSGALGSRALLTVPSELLQYAVRLFAAEVWSGPAWGRVVVGLLVAGAVLGLRAGAARRTGSKADRDAHAPGRT